MRLHAGKARPSRPCQPVSWVDFNHVTRTGQWRCQPALQFSKRLLHVCFRLWIWRCGAAAIGPILSQVSRPSNHRQGAHIQKSVSYSEVARLESEVRLKLGWTLVISTPAVNHPWEP